jgi:predicted acylesterase/phospholipase RssA
VAERKIERIGLAFSGGGYRAAGFHLGVLDMLARLQLLDRVKGLSTVSGGTITGAYYALQIGRGKRPEEIIPALAGWLVRNDVIDRALKEHPAKHRHAKSRRRDLICSASEVYDGMLGGALFGEVFDHSGHLEDVIFNSTEFATGLDFRFQKVSNPAAHIGNSKWHITRDVAKQLRLADIVAASSCFPAGFEPLEFPADFVFPGETPEMPGIPPHFTIMDGGIYDNQGSEALLMAPQDRESYDVVIISDTDQREKDAIYSVPEQQGSRGINIGFLVTIIALLGALTAGGAVNNAVYLLQTQAPWWEIILSLLGSLVASIGFGALWWGWRRAKAAIAKSYPNLASDIRTYLFSLRWSDLEDFISLRAGSLIAMSSTIFLKRIRQLGYDRIQNDPALDRKTVKNLIYGLATKIGKAELPPTPEQQQIAERANQMSTTLWFDDVNQFRDVFAAGQNTVVHALLRWMERGQKKEEVEGEVSSRLREMWKQLQENPFRFVPDVSGGSAGASGGTVAALGAGVAPRAAVAAPKRETA